MDIDEFLAIFENILPKHYRNRSLVEHVLLKPKLQTQGTSLHARKTIRGYPTEAYNEMEPWSSWHEFGSRRAVSIL